MRLHHLRCWIPAAALGISCHLSAVGACKGPDALSALKEACGKHGLLFGIQPSPLEFPGSPKGFDEAVAEGFDFRTPGPVPGEPDGPLVVVMLSVQGNPAPARP